MRALPRGVRRSFGQALYTAQHGATGLDRPGGKAAERLHGIRVMEIVERYRTDAYRAVYTAQFDEAVYVLHVFQKKSKSGIATPKPDIGPIRARLAEAERHHRQRGN